MFRRGASPRLIGTVTLTSLLVACSGQTTSVPGDAKPSASPPAPQSTARSAQRWTSATVLGAKPVSVAFTGEQASSRTPQTVTILARWWLAGYFDPAKPATVTVAGTGNCPSVSPQTLRFTSREKHRHGFAWNDDDAVGATLTVRPTGSGTAACTITVLHADDPHDDDDGKHSVTIAVTVGATPAP